MSKQDSKSSQSIIARETIEANMTHTLSAIHVSQDKQKDHSGNKEQSPNTPKVINICDHCPPGGTPMKTFEKALRNTILEGEFNGELVILVVGRTGEGKSTLINSIIELNEKIAEEGARRDACTESIQSYYYSNIIPGITITLVDTPGLQDTQAKEQTYIELIKEKCPQVNLIFYCLKMTDVRTVNDDKVAMQKLYQAFGPKFWERVVFVFTWSNSLREICEISNERDEEVEEPPIEDTEAWKDLKIKRFKGRFDCRKKDIKDFVAKEVLNESDLAVVEQIGYVFAGHNKPIPSQPDPYHLFGSENWLYDLAKPCCENIKSKHRFVKLTLNDRINFVIIVDNSSENKDMESLNDQAKTTKETLQNLGFCVFYFNCLSSHCIRQLFQAFQYVDHSQLAIIGLVILSNGSTRHVYGADNEFVTFEEIFSYFCYDEISKIPKFFFFHLTHDSTSNHLDFNVNIPNNSIAFVASFHQNTIIKLSPAIASFIAHVKFGNRKLSQCFEKIKDQCCKLPEAQCCCLDTLQDNFVLPFPRDSCEEASYTEKEIDICRTIWYQVRCETIDILLKNKNEVMNIVMSERWGKIISSAVNIVGGCLVVGGLIWAPFTFGASLQLSLAGSIITGVGAAGGFAAQVTSLVYSNKCLRIAQDHVRMDQQLSIVLNAIGTKYNKVFKAQKGTIFVSGIQATAGAAGAARFGFVLLKQALQEGGEVVAETAGRAVGGVVAAVTIPVDVSLMIYNIYQIYKAKKDDSGSTDNNKAINEFVKQIESSIKGFFTIIDEREYKYDSAIIALTDNECGYTVHVPQSITSQPTITIATILSGPFKFPEGTTLVSAIYDVKIDVDLNNPITLDIEHCVDNPINSTMMTFAIGNVKMDQKVFDFLPLEGGVFLCDKQYGSIKIEKSCLLCILYYNSQSLQVKYAAQSSYRKINNNFWKIKCIFSKCLNAYVKFGRQFGETEVYPFNYTQPNAPYINLDEVRCEIKTVDKWSISPCTVSNDIQKTELDAIEYSKSHKLLRQIIPFFELDIVQTDEATNDSLRYTVQFRGTNLKLFIACNK